MTERYTLYDIAPLSTRYKLPDGLPKGIKPSYNRRPGVLHPVILIKEGKRIAQRMLWGLQPDHAKDANSIFRFKTYNVKSEVIFTKPSTSNAIRTKRCLVPVDGFYQWRKTANGPEAFYITRADKQPFTLAGIHSSWKTPSGELEGTYSIVTCEANDDLAPISDRMPIVLHPEDEATWLDPETYDTTTLYRLMQSCPNGVLKATPVDAGIVAAKKHTADLIQPLSSRA